MNFSRIMRRVFSSKIKDQTAFWMGEGTLVLVMVLGVLCIILNGAEQPTPMLFKWIATTLVLTAVFLIGGSIIKQMIDII